MKTGSASNSVDDLFKSLALAGRRLVTRITLQRVEKKKKKMQAAAWNPRTSNRIDPNPNGIDCYHEQGQVLKTAGASNPDARVGTQSSTGFLHTQKKTDQDSRLSFIKGLAFGNNLSPSRTATRRRPLCLRSALPPFPTFPSVNDVFTDQGGPGPKDVTPSCAKWLKFCFSALLRASASGKAAAWTGRCPVCLTTARIALANQLQNQRTLKATPNVQKGPSLRCRIPGDWWVMRIHMVLLLLFAGHPGISGCRGRWHRNLGMSMLSDAK